MQQIDATVVPLVDLKAQYRAIQSEIDRAVHGAIESADFILGTEVEAFEQEFAAYCGVRHAVGCGSGTEALHLGLRALGIGEEDEVIMPAMTFVATALAIVKCGARPVLVDIRPETGLADPAGVAAAITPKTRAIIPVHLLGQCADMDAINDLARRHNLRVVEDAAQAHGAHRSGVRAGALGDIGCFSFHPVKNLGAYGDGGLVTTNDAEVADKLRLLRNWGSRKRYGHEVMGYNSRLDTIQAAVLRVKLKNLDQWNALRREHAHSYDALLHPLKGIRCTQYDSGSVYHLYVIHSDARDEMLSALNAAGIGAATHYPAAIHQLPAYSWLGYPEGSFPGSEYWARTCISLPMYAELPECAPRRAAAVLANQLSVGESHSRSN